MEHRAARRTADGDYMCTHCGRRWDADDTPPPCDPPKPVKYTHRSSVWNKADWKKAKEKPITPEMWQDLRDKLNGKEDK